MIQPVQARVFKKQFKIHGLENHSINFLLSRDINVPSRVYFDKFKFAFNMMTFITSLNLEVTDEIKESLNEVLDELTIQRLQRKQRQSSYLDVRMEDVITRFEKVIPSLTSSPSPA